MSKQNKHKWALLFSSKFSTFIMESYFFDEMMQSVCILLDQHAEL